MKTFLGILLFTTVVLKSAMADALFIDRSMPALSALQSQMSHLDEVIKVLQNLKRFDSVSYEDLNKIVREGGLEAIHTNSAFAKRYSEVLSEVYKIHTYAIFCGEAGVHYQTFTDDDCGLVTSSTDSERCLDYFLENRWASKIKFEARRFSSYWEFQTCR